MRALIRQLIVKAPFNNFSRMLGNSKKEFENAVKLLTSLKDDPGNETKLQLYALYKQATIGKCNTPKPGLMDLTGKVKWQAWNSLQNMSQSEAQSNYVDIVKNLLKLDSKKDDCEEKGLDIISEIDGKVYKIVINRPSRKNALTTEMYDSISDSLEEASKSDATLAVVTGAGDYYSSGNDLANILKAGSQDYNQYATAGRDLLKRFVSAFIEFPKPLIAIVNGPAMGIMTTTLPLFDGVLASDKATFQTVFSSLGMTPEGCSSFTFPLIMGHTKACDMLLFNKRITAQEAKDLGLVTDVFPSLSFQDEAWKRIVQISESPPEVLRLSKQLVRENFRQTLHDVNERECDLLLSRWLSQDFKDTILNVIQKKSSL